MQAPPAPQVGVVEVQSQTVPLTDTLVGRLAPTRVAEVRARVTGIVEARTYTEGSHVEEGDVLFRIDPAPLQATLAQREAALKQALATARNAERHAERAQSLSERGVLSKQDLDDAEAKARTSAAAVAQARAAVKTAQLDLSYATVTAPITGRAGRALVTEGALVSQSSATELTTIEQIDPLYVNFSRPVAVVSRWRKSRANGSVSMDPAQKITLEVRLADGSTYDHAGTLDFTASRVDPETGSVSLRATIPNPDHTLLPGMFVNLTLNAGTLNDIMLLPQEAVLRDGQGAYVLTVDAEGKVGRVAVHTRGTRAGQWIVDGGLEDGQTIIVSGLQHTRPGGNVRAVPWSPPVAANASSTPSPQ